MTTATGSSARPNLVKVLFYSNDNGGDSNTETLWAEPVGEDLYKLLNSPFFFYGASFEDIVRALPAGDGMLEFEEVVGRSGSSTYRVLVRKDCAQEQFDDYRGRLVALGCSIERAQGRLYAIDVPPGVDVDQVVQLLDAGDSNEVWDWEEGYRHDGSAPPQRHH